MADDLPSLGELNRNIVRLSQELSDTRRELTQLHELRTRAELNRRSIADAHERIDDLESGVTWALRLVLGALALAMLGLVIASPVLA